VRRCSNVLRLHVRRCKVQTMRKPISGSPSVNLGRSLLLKEANAFCSLVYSERVLELLYLPFRVCPWANVAVADGLAAWEIRPRVVVVGCFVALLQQEYRSPFQKRIHHG
jgi:hypothetical protein